MLYRIFIGCLLCASAALAEERTIALFDGKSLDGWTTQSGQPVTKGWIVQDGMLVRESRGGPIYPPGEYGDFELRFEWKIARKGNSGIKYRVQFYKKGVRGNPGWLGCEYQLFDDKGRRTKPKTSAGALYGLYAPNEEKKLMPVGEFNTSRIVVRGTKIQHWLNGKQVVTADTSSPEWQQRIASSKFGIVKDFFTNAKGRLEFQDHGSKVWFRNIQLTIYDPK